jgi:hypothetical protein
LIQKKMKKGVRMSQIINLCVVHNNEADRLKYLLPRVNMLAALLADGGVKAFIHEIGPDASGMADKVARHTPVNRLKRALHGSYMYARFNDRDPRVRGGAFRKLRRRYRQFERLIKYARSVKIEQEVLFAHATGWEIGARSGGYTIILESDAIFSERSSENLCNLVKHIFEHVSEPRVYIDLAGGCNVKDILNGWYFEPAGGKEDFSISSISNVIFHKIPSITTNTVAGYLISADIAKLFLVMLEETKPMLAPDWAINFFSLKNKLINSALCIHSTPTLLSQGSHDGTYISTIEARKN